MRGENRLQGMQKRIGNKQFDAKTGLKGVLLLVLVLTILFFAVAVVSSKAQLVGVVCLAPTSATSCPSPPVTLTGTVGSQLQASVLVEGSDSFSGFDITLKTNHTVLTPTNADPSGGLLSGGTVVLECIGRLLKAGARCGATDTADTLHLTYVGPPGFLTPAPTSGKLFTATFNVSGTSAVSLGYQTGCSPSSVPGSSTCVLLANGGLLNPQETAQTASYTQTPSPTFAISSSRSEITITKGQSANTTISIMSLNGFAGTVTFSAVLTPSAQHQPIFSITPSTTSLMLGGVANATVIMSTKQNTSKLAYDLVISCTGSGVSGSIMIPVSVIS